MKRYALIMCLTLPLNIYAADLVDSATDSIKNTSKDISNAAQDAGKTISTTATDISITTQIKALLALESDIPMGISVTTKNGVVSLVGVVDTKLQADKIIQIAEGVKGVNGIIDSELKVADSEDYISDAMITTKAKAKIFQLSQENKIDEKYDLDVETTNGVVHLFGHTANAKDIKTVETAIREINGVKSIKLNVDHK